MPKFWVKYWCIVKVDNTRFVKYRVSQFVSFAAFLDRNFPDWRYFNVYEYGGTNDRTGRQVASFTRNNRPKKQRLQDT